MVHAELLRYLVEALDRLQLRYAVTGSTATSVYGEARMTNDIDVVVELSPSRVEDILAAFPSPGFTSVVQPSNRRCEAADSSI